LARDCRYLHSSHGFPRAPELPYSLAGIPQWHGLLDAGLVQLEEILKVNNPYHRDFAGWSIRRVLQMIRALSLALLCAALGTSLLPAGDLSTYRGFRFGMSIQQVADQAGMKTTEAATVHQQPALIQVLDFQPNLFHASTAQDDPVSEITLTFCNGELARIAVIYDRYKVDGMTEDDMTKALSVAYGTAAQPKAQIAYHSYYAESAPVLARWEDSQYSYNLIRSGDRSTFAMVLASKQLDALAQTAILEAVRVEALAEPEREAERARKQADDNQALQEKSRLSNIAGFRP
jgi:hypothetical protein